MKQQSAGGGGGVGFGARCDLKLKVKAKLFVLCFAIKKKRSSEYLYYSSRYLLCLFTVCLGYVQGKKFERINQQRDERRRSETKGGKWNQASIKVESVSARYYQQGELFSLLTEKVKDFQLFENKKVNITWGENWCFLEQRVLRYARMRPRGSRHKNCLHCTRSQ